MGLTCPLSRDAHVASAPRSTRKIAISRVPVQW
jgi:hypothetical protein